MVGLGLLLARETRSDTVRSCHAVTRNFEIDRGMEFTLDLDSLIALITLEDPTITSFLISQP